MARRCGNGHYNPGEERMITNASFEWSWSAAGKVAVLLQLDGLADFLRALNATATRQMTMRLATINRSR